ncbi:MAG: Wzz/FepE/Etk N-terminal domain-containing protein [Solirubrobacteraceae bacterium]
MTEWPRTPELEPPAERSTLIDAVRVIRERWWLVLICFVVCLGVAVALAARSVKQYTATASVIVRPSNLPALIDPTQTQATDAATLAREQSDDVSLITSGPVAAMVRQSLHSSASAADLQKHVSATAGASNDLIDIAATDPNPARAAAIANAFAGSLVTYLTQSAQAQLVSGKAHLQSELAQLPANDPGRTPLQLALKQVIALQAVTNGGAQVVDSATPPSSPSSAGIKRIGAIGAVVGIVIGLLLAFLLDRFDRRIKSTEALEHLYGLSALTSVPLHRRQATGGRQDDGALEPFRILRDGLGYVSLREHPRVIFVTSAVSDEGKTWVATGLARAMAAAGRRVVLVEGDVHRPAVKRQFGLPAGGHGLMNSLVEGGRVLGYVQAAPPMTTLSILGSGPFTPSSAELLRLPAMNRALRELAGAFDFVVVDGPPLLPVADAQAMLVHPGIDVVLLVARPYLTKREHIRGALAVLKRHPEKGVGLVVNAVREKSRGYYQYGTQRSDEESIKPEPAIAAEAPWPAKGYERPDVEVPPRPPQPPSPSHRSPGPAPR